MANLHETTIRPPYTNRWGCKPGPDYRRCQGTTKADEQCRRGADRGRNTCTQHARDDV